VNSFDHWLQRMVKEIPGSSAGWWIFCLAAVVSLIPTPAVAGDWYVLCEVGSGEVVVDETPEAGRHQVLAGPFPGRRTAGMWIDEHHPDHRCDSTPPEQDTDTTAPATGSWLAVCEPGTMQVKVLQGLPPTGYQMLVGDTFGATVHGDQAAARAWTDAVCPSWRCDPRGRCVAAAVPPESDQTGGGWVVGQLTTGTQNPATGGGWSAGELNSSTLDGGRASARPVAARVAVAGPQTVSGPGGADLRPLIDNATAAVSSCAYPAALASADHMLNFDPKHPWLTANHDKLRRLAGRQRDTEQLVWQASSALQAGKLKQARELAQLAADSAVSCQTPAVSQLLDGIDTAIEQKKARRSAANRRAAAALLPGLIDLAGVISGQQSGGSLPTAGMTASSLPAAAASATVDPCAFKYEYRNVWNTEPVCTCAGYVFDQRQFRCVR
jgi:hypothetical protein